jgi:hypothetical protein
MFRKLGMIWGFHGGEYGEWCLLGCYALVRTDVSEELSASFIRVTRIGALEATLAVTSNRCTLLFLRSVRRLLVRASVVPSSPILVSLMKEVLSSSETSVLTRVTRQTSQKTPFFFRRLDPFPSSGELGEGGILLLSSVPWNELTWITERGNGPHTHWCWVLLTIVRTLQILLSIRTSY